jgi:hypothetical protein
MAGTSKGGKQAASTTKRLHGEDFYVRAGKKGGRSQSLSKGFASKKLGKDGLTGRQRAHIVGAIGGRNGKRTGYKALAQEITQ